LEDIKTAYLKMFKKTLYVRSANDNILRILNEI